MSNSMQHCACTCTAQGGGGQGASVERGRCLGSAKGQRTSGVGPWIPWAASDSHTGCPTTASPPLLVLTCSGQPGDWRGVPRGGPGARGGAGGLLLDALQGPGEPGPAGMLLVLAPLFLVASGWRQWPVLLPAGCAAAYMGAGLLPLYCQRVRHSTMQAVLKPPCYCWPALLQGEDGFMVYLRKMNLEVLQR